MTSTYNVTRQQAADYLGVSTRTIDRYVKKWTLNYKKVSNKVILSQEELDILKKDLDLLNQPAAQVTRERIATEKSSSKTTLADPETATWLESVTQFAAILTQKDMAIEEKNQLIYLLQRKIGEIETQMQHMVALPHHTEEKEQLSAKIAELSSEKETLKSQVRKEKIRNFIFFAMILVAIGVLLLLIFQ